MSDVYKQIKRLRNYILINSSADIVSVKINNNIGINGWNLIKEQYPDLNVDEYNKHEFYYNIDRNTVLFILKNIEQIRSGRMLTNISTFKGEFTPDKSILELVKVNLLVEAEPIIKESLIKEMVSIRENEIMNGNSLLIEKSNS